MDSPRRNLALAATVLAALAAWFGTGLHPWWPLAWLLPFFAFLAAASVRGWRRFLPGMLALLVGGANMWNYLSLVPPLIRPLLLLIPAVAFGCSTAVFGALLRRGRPGLALVMPAALFVAYEYGYSLVSPHSTFGALAYTQVNCLPILQLASLGGIWLIDGLIFFVAAGAALLVLGGDAAVRRRSLAGLAFLSLVAAVVFGAFRLHTPPPIRTMTVGLLASDTPENLWFGKPEDSAAIAHRYLAEVPSLARDGATWVVLPEAVFALRESAPDENARELEPLLRQCAVDNHIHLLVGVARRDPHQVSWNEARIYSPDGTVTTYDKHHLLIPGEDIFTRGNRYTVETVADTTVGFAVCKDLDFTATGRAYADRRADVLIVPAHDFRVDGWLHCRMAVVRAVESGFSLVRCAKEGLLTVADNRGRILAETASSSADYARLLARCPLGRTPTVYARWGDWFAWACLGALLTFPAWRRRASR